VWAMGAATGLLTLAVGTQASAQHRTYTTTQPGAVVAVGNTLGLAKAPGQNGPGTSDSIGAFIALDQTAVDDTPANPSNPWPAGTTYDWTLDGSTAVLALPTKATVLHAELIWGGSYLYGSEDVTASINSAVTLSVGGQSLSVLPDVDTALKIQETSHTGFAANYYLSSAHVTQFVAQNMGGVYSASGVPSMLRVGRWWWPTATRISRSAT
jgi:hypothetical protein